LSGSSLFRTTRTRSAVPADRSICNAFITDGQLTLVPVHSYPLSASLGCESGRARLDRGRRCMVLNVLGAGIVLAALWTAIAICTDKAGMRYRAFAVKAPVDRAERARRSY
jgi:hypothetical protein